MQTSSEHILPDADRHVNGISTHQTVACVANRVGHSNKRATADGASISGAVAKMAKIGRADVLPCEP